MEKEEHRLTEVLLEVKDLATYYYTIDGVLKAVDGLSFKIEKGEALGILGESGSGKSTVAWSIMRMVAPPGKIVRGQIFYESQDILKVNDNRMREIRWKNISMIPQSSMSALDPLMTVYDQIAEPILVHEEALHAEIPSRVKDLFEKVGIVRSRSRNYPHEFSGGMRQRTMIAMALACNPSLIIADEPTTALDVIVQAQILKLLAELRDKIESSIMLITHDLSVIAEICDMVAVMYAGKIVEYANSSAVMDKPIHPYTRALVSAFPRIDEDQMTFESIPGAPPNMINPPVGCRFHPRCQFARDRCHKEEPKITEVEPNHLVACHQMGKI